LIYGIAEFANEPLNHLPERFDPIQRSEISREWLDQVIQSIQPRIEGVVIHSVTISVSDNAVCYVVEVPQSHTAHMARDHRYHKRHNFTTAHMEDYEVRDVMNRRTQPKIRGSIFINRYASKTEPEGVILVKLENVGNVLVRHIMVDLELPLDIKGIISVDGEDVYMEERDGEFFYHFRLAAGLPQSPIFPGSYVMLRRIIHTNVTLRHADGKVFKSTQHLNVSVFSDESPPIKATLELEPLLRGWTVLQSVEGVVH